MITLCEMSRIGKPIEETKWISGFLQPGLMKGEESNS